MGSSVGGGTGSGVQSSAPASPWRVAPSPGGLRLFGSLRTPEAAEIVAALREATPGAQAVELDLSGVEQIDGGVIAAVRAELAGRGVRVAARGADQFQRLFDLYAGAQPSTPEKSRAEPMAAQVGRIVVHEAGEIKGALGFIGHTAAAAGRVVVHPGTAHWSELLPLVEHAGADALPIVLAINFLIGFVITYMSAQSLSLFGANVYVADLIALAMTRQLAPLMTAIVVCGRSGAGFATELGSMKVAEEIDALRTLGLEPFGWLVLPRTLTLVIVLPLLTILGSVVGIVGGWLVGVLSLGLTTQGFLSQTREALTAWDIESGLWMSLAFAIAIGLIACQQGFAATGGAQGVGRRTTRTVVASLFAIVLIDAVFTVIYRVFGLS